MPIYEIICQECNHQAEVLLLNSTTPPTCPACGSLRTEKLISPTSSLTGRTGQSLPGRGDTACCGTSPSMAGCAGPGSCCGKTP